VAKRASGGRRSGRGATAKRASGTSKAVSKRGRSGGAKKRPASRKRPVKKARPKPRALKTARARTKGAARKTSTARRKNAARSAAARSTRRKSTPGSKSDSLFASTKTALAGSLAGTVAAVAQRLPWSSSGTDALTLLETDHRRLESLLAKGEETTDRAVKGRTELLHTLTAELNLHELIEEKVLYPVLKTHPEAKAVVLEGFEEHHVADTIVNELHRLAKDNEQWGAKFRVLKENIEHHIEEEEGQMFRTARAVLSREELHELGARMAQMKVDAQRGAGSA
jgi:hypothetical protein